MLKNLNRRLLGAASFLIIAASVSPAVAQGSSQGNLKAFDIPAQPLSTALLEFSRQSNMAVGVDPALVSGEHVAPLKGNFSPNDALNKLLEGHGLTATTRPDGGVVITKVASATNAQDSRRDAHPNSQAPEVAHPQNPIKLAAVQEVQLPASRSEEATGEPSKTEEVVVTGTRIRTTDTTTPAPVTVINPQIFDDQGFVQVGQALAEVTSNITILPQSSSNSPAANQGQQFPNLFNLGANRTLSLLNGRRLPTTSSGLGGAETDTNIVPVGLLERVDVVEGGGAAVYGSGAMAGVVNYVLKQNFHGVTADAQYSLSDYGDYPVYSVRLTAGTNFADGRGNAAIDVGFSQTGSLLQSQRSYGAAFPIPVSNPAYVPNQGLKTTIDLLNSHEATDTVGGVVLNSPTNPFATNVLQVNGVGFRFNPNGSLAAYNPGVDAPTAGGLSIGGDGYPLGSENTLLDGIERATVNGIAHYDVTDHLKVSTELMYARTDATDPINRLTRADIGPIGNAPSLSFNKNDPFLTPAAVAALSAASPTFAGGGNLYLGDMATDLLPTNSVTTTTKTLRGLFALDGDFDVGTHNFYWSASFSHAESDENTMGWGVITQNLINAMQQPIVNAQGQIVCNPAVVSDPKCVPINLFGTGNISPAARAYVTAPNGLNAGGGTPYANFNNKMDDVLATIGGDLVQLPGGASKFSLTYEHRGESSSLIPFEANALGIVGNGSVAVPAAGSYHTNEYAGELLIPVLGKDFNIPFTKALDLNGSYRVVDHSITGSEDVWGAGVRWETEAGITLRGSLSRNFLSPTLTQLIAPQSVAFTAVNNPCSANQINSGVNPTVRQANCLALFTANPGYGAIASNPAATAAQRLAAFTDPSATTNFPAVTSGGNSSLVDEISHVETFGVVLQPTFAPGLTISADRVIIGLNNFITTFTPSTFLSNCFDSKTYPNALCNTATYRANGTISAAFSESFNAYYDRYKGEIYNIDYRFALNDVFGGRDIGNLDLNLQASRNTGAWQVQPLVTSETDGTTTLPTWLANFYAHYTYGSWRVNYTLNFRPQEPVNVTDTYLNAPVYPIHANVVQSISAQYSFMQHYAVRFGINNITNQAPSFPTTTYGDIVGRQYFIGGKVTY